MEISVVVPVYQAEKYVNRLFESIENQSYRDFSLFLVDDGSWDDSAMLCDEYALSGSNVIICHKKNGGAGAARNNGIEYTLVSDSRWLAFLDSDDWMYGDYFKILYDGAINNGTSVAMCSALDTTDVGYKFPDNMEAKVTLKTPEELWCENRNLCVVPWGKIFRKELIKDIRFPEGKIKEDEAFSYRIMFQCKQMAYSDAKIYAYYQSPNSVMRSKWSLKELDDMDTLDQQVDYFWKNGFEKACVVSARENIFSLSTYIKQLKLHKYDKTIISEVTKRRKNNIKHFQKHIGIPVKGNEWMYALVYPLEMKVYYGVKKIRRIICRK